MGLLRPRQEAFVERSLQALATEQNTLSVAPTGFGKSRCMSAVIEDFLQKQREITEGHARDRDVRACVLAHRDELIYQNRAQFDGFVSAKQHAAERPYPLLTSSLVNASDKSWEGHAVFAMVPTLAREKHLKTMPPLDLLVIDEAHHCAASSYQKIIQTAQVLNPKVAIFGVTASPSRSDKKSLRAVFNNVADQVMLAEVIGAGHLVPPVTFVIDVGVQKDLQALTEQARNKKNNKNNKNNKSKKSTGNDAFSDDVDMEAVARIMDHPVIHAAVIKHWKEKAGDRKTIVFCSTVSHAQHTCEAFIDADVKAAVIHGGLTREERLAVLARFEQGDLQVLLNCFVLTEGYDCPLVSCVILLRPSSHISTFIQCVGRGLRIVDPEKYPGVVKTDCIVLDFGTSALTHGCLEADVSEALAKEKTPQSDDSAWAADTHCTACNAKIPRRVTTCPLCGEDQIAIPVETVVESELPEKVLPSFVMSEIDLLARSSFHWVDLFGRGDTLMATGFNAWAGVFQMDDDWFALGGIRKHSAQMLQRGDYQTALRCADQWLKEHENEHGTRKSKKWLHETATTSQLNYLPEHQYDFGLTRYHASCLITFKFNKHAIRMAIYAEAETRHQETSLSYPASHILTQQKTPIEQIRM